MAALQCGCPVDAPTSSHEVREPPFGHEALALAEGKFVTTAEVEDVPNIEISQAIVTLRFRNQERLERDSLGHSVVVQQVDGVGTHLDQVYVPRKFKPSAKCFSSLT